MEINSKDMDGSSTGLSRGLAVWEIASVLSSCLIAEWVVLAFVGRNRLITAVPLVLVAGLMWVSHRERREGLYDIGIRTDNLLAACRLLLLPTAAAVLLIIASSWFMGYTRMGSLWRPRLITIPVWALTQQYVLNGFINRRAQLVFGKGLKSIVLVALFFSLLHLPSPILAVSTLAGGLIWAAVYQRQPNLFAVTLSHSVISITIALTMRPSLLYNLRVGFKYFG